MFEAMSHIWFASYIIGIAQDITLIGALASTTLNLQQWFQIPISVATLDQKTSLNHLKSTISKMVSQFYLKIILEPSLFILCLLLLKSTVNKNELRDMFTSQQEKDHKDLYYLQLQLQELDFSLNEMLGTIKQSNW